MSAVERAILIAWRAISVAVATSPIRPGWQKTAAYYLLVTGANLPMEVTARVVGCTKQNISKSLREVEDRRDDPEYDAALTRLERLIFGE